MFLACAGLSCLGAIPAAAQADEPRPVLVELFSSQSCVACPTANSILIDLAETDQHIFPIVWSVPYWEYMGVEEEYAEPEFLVRQRNYAEAFDLRGPYTPQVVVDGCTQNSGVSADNIVERVDHVDHETDPGVRVQVANGRVTVTTPQASAPSDVWLVGYRPGITVLSPDRGGNSGTELPHLHLATGLQKIGVWDGTDTAAFDFECEHEACLIILQEQESYEILDFGLVPQVAG